MSCNPPSLSKTRNWMSKLSKRWYYAGPWKASSSKIVDHSEEPPALPSESWPIFPPPPPEQILADRPGYRATFLKPRRFAAPKGEFHDTSLYALYRLYEWFLLDHVVGYRNDLEIFWRTEKWRIQNIPDPMDDCPSRYAFLAGITHLLVTSFNQKVSYGASRDAPAIMSGKDADALKDVPLGERRWEMTPDWAERVSPLEHVLSIPTHEDEWLHGVDDPKAEPFFKSKNILIWTPHIHFT